MSANLSYHARTDYGGPLRAAALRDTLLIGMFLLAAVPASKALGGEQPQVLGDALHPDFSALAASAPTWVPGSSVPDLSIPAAFRTALVLPADPPLTRDFRRGGHSVSDRDNPTVRHEDLPMLGTTTVWQRLAEFRGHNRVRLVTLWEAAGSSVSLQAGRRGDPSLQWTSHFMNHGGATRGLFDQVISVSLAHAGRSLHSAPSATSREPQAKLPKLLPDGGNK